MLGPPLMLIAFVNVVIMILLSLEVARQFGKGTGFCLGSTFRTFVFRALPGFGDAKCRNLPGAA